MVTALLGPDLFGDYLGDPAIAAVFGAPAFTRRMLDFESAWTRGMLAAGQIGAPEAEAALAVIAAYRPQDLGAGSLRDGLPVPQMVAELRAGQPAPVARAIHSGATSQDVIDSALMLSALAVLDLLEPRLAALLAGLEDLAARFGAAPLMARTRMQAALPARGALRIGAWQRALADRQAALAGLRGKLSRVQIGGAIGDRPIPAQQAKAVADALGLTLTPVWHSDRAAPVEFGHGLALLAGTLGKIGQDIALMAQQGLDEVRLSGAGGSSAMPHKQNPVGAEAMVALGRYVAGLQGILGQAMIHEQERSGVGLALEWLTLPAMAEATGAALNHGQALMAGITRLGGEAAGG